VNLLRGQVNPKFIPIGKDELVKVENEWKKQDQIQVVQHPDQKTDEELMTQHLIIKKSRKSLCFKPFIAYKGLVARIWWLKKEDLSICSLRGVNLDIQNCSSKLTIVARARYRKSKVDVLRNLLQGDGWIVGPYEHYLKLDEKISIHLPFKVKVPLTDKELGPMIKTVDDMKYIDLEVSQDIPLEPGGGSLEEYRDEDVMY